MFLCHFLYDFVSDIALCACKDPMISNRPMKLNTEIVLLSFSSALLRKPALKFIIGTSGCIFRSNIMSGMLFHIFPI